MFGALLSLAGAILFLTALAMTLRANATTAIPFWHSPVTTPVGSVAMRSLGVGFLVFGAALLIADVGWWPVVIVLVIPGATLLAIALHNRRIALRERGA